MEVLWKKGVTYIPPDGVVYSLTDPLELGLKESWR